MTTIPVKASRSYDVLIGDHLLENAASYIKTVSAPKKAAIISDSNVAPQYASIVAKSLTDTGIETVEYVIPAGEGSKTLATFGSILNFLAENQLTRADILIALGGGVVGDITGFAAACYLRGISFIQIPTSLLAMVDSSVGGKTAIDLPAGKNLAGAFYQPSLVLCDTHVLNTLPEEIFREGCAEVIKYGVLYDPDLLETLLAEGMHFNRQQVIPRCISLKRDVVAQDEFDKGQRQLLNLGHTIGHAVELLSNMTISHGNAVAIGMAVAARAAANINICSNDTAKRIIAAIQKFGLPTATTYPVKDIANAILTDKKRFADTVNLILPKAIGNCAIIPTHINELESFLKAGM
jgi:3-dehydroquinate synthase